MRHQLKKFKTFPISLILYLLLCKSRILLLSFSPILFSVINTGNGDNSLDYHAVSVDTADGTILRNIALQLINIPNVRIDNTAFWLVSCEIYRPVYHMIIYYVI